jgi:hypothetical protein
VKTERPIASEGEHRVLQFRPRGPVRSTGWQENVAARPGRPTTTPTEFLDLSRYERPRQSQEADEPDEFRQRMLANIAGFAFTIALMAIGIWLVMSIADLRRTQDCVLMGRHDCVQLSTP